MRFVPRSFDPPERLETETFTLKPLTIHDVVKDYEAVMTSREHLWKRFGESWGWPKEDLTLEQDLIDLAWHQNEAQIRSTFAYAVFNPDESRITGCVYLDPPRLEATDAEVWFWARESELSSGLEDHLETQLCLWLKEAWPFDKVTLNSKLVELT